MAVAHFRWPLLLRITTTLRRILSGVFCGQDGDQLTYYALGNCEPKGSFKVGQVTHAEKNVKLKSKGNLQKAAMMGAGEANVSEHKPWKKFAMRLDLGPKLEYIICPPDQNSMDIWYEAFEPRVKGELKVYLDRGSLSTWVTKWGQLHKTQLEYYDNKQTADGGEPAQVWQLKHGAQFTHYSRMKMPHASRACG